jgi:hypothetical protein
MVFGRLLGVCMVTLSRCRLLHDRDQSPVSGLTDKQDTEISSYVCVYFFEDELKQLPADRYLPWAVEQHGPFLSEERMKHAWRNF